MRFIGHDTLELITDLVYIIQQQQKHQAHSKQELSTLFVIKHTHQLWFQGCQRIKIAFYY